MHRHSDTKVYSRGKGRSISAARVQAILSSIPRDKVDLIGNLGNDWKDIEQGIIAAVRINLEVSLRIHGHRAITEDLPLLLQSPGEYPVIAHQSYIKKVTTDKLLILSASQIRQLFDGIEISDEDMQAIMRSAAAQVKRTPDEPKLTVVATDGNIIVTFAN